MLNSIDINTLTRYRNVSQKPSDHGDLWLQWQDMEP